MKEIYVIVKFKLNEGIDISEWKEISDGINKDIVSADWLQFRDSGVDENWYVYCIIKWDNLDKQVTFRAALDKKMEENPEMWRVWNMITMTMDKITLI